MTLVTFEGARNFRSRLVLATLAGRHVRITKIRPADLNPGLRDHEVLFLRLLEAITNGSHIEISYTGTTVIYKPGIIIGGEHTHTCGGSKPVGYFLEPLLLMAPFAKNKFLLVLRGLTASDRGRDAGVEAIKWGLFPVLEKFGVREVELHVLKRGAPPLGGGEVHFVCNSLLAQPLTLHATEVPRMLAFRGVAYCTRVSPTVVNRVIDAARRVLRPTGVEVNITSDVWRGENSGKSPGFGVALVAELKRGWRIVAEGTGLPGLLPEELGERVALQLLEELSTCGVVGRNQLKLALALMALGKEDVGRLALHREQVDEEAVLFLRDIKSIFGIEAIVKEDEAVTLAIRGSGFSSSAKKIAGF